MRAELEGRMTKPTQLSSLGLRSIELLHGLSSERLDEISRQCVWRPFEPRQTLIAREQGDRSVHLIVAGAMRVTSYSSGGRETSFRDLSAGAKCTTYRTGIKTWCGRFMDWCPNNW